MGTSANNGNRVTAFVVITIFMILVAGAFWALFFWLSGSLMQRLSLLFGIFGVYGLALGFFAKSKVLAEFRGLLEDLTSPNPIDYFAANFHLLSIIFLLPSVALSKYRTMDHPVFLGFLGSMLCFVLTPVAFVYALIHILVVMTLTYIPVVLASSIVAAVVYSATDFDVSREGKHISIRSIVESDEVAAKAFLVGIPGFIMSFAAKVTAFLYAG